MSFNKCFSKFSILLLSCTITLANAATESSETISPEEVQRLGTTIHEIKKYYVEAVPDKKLFEDAIRGMVSGLDPHSDYLNAEDLRDLNDATSGEFSGLGLEVDMENGYIKVVTPLDDSPAQRAGIKPGDVIVRLNDTPVKGLTLRQAINKMRGTVGTSINITIIRQGTEKPLLFKLTRQVIRLQSVKYRLLDNQYGYVRITSFQKKTGMNLENAVVDLTKKAGGRLKGLILDLRNNPGGLLDAAVEVSDAFLPKMHTHNDLIVYTKGKGKLPSSEFEARATGGDIINGAPLVVLINGGSASASEIVAGALQDQKRAIIVGTNSFGKGSVQTVIPIDDNSAIKLTTALYYTPAGRSIQAEGIKPDIVIDDLKVMAHDDDDKKFTYIKEADLENHLANGNTVKTTTKTTTVISPTPTSSDNKQEQSSGISGNQGLAIDDYQLHEALNILKGMTINAKIASH